MLLQLAPCIEQSLAITVCFGPGSDGIGSGIGVTSPLAVFRKTAPHEQCASLGVLGARMQCHTAPTVGACWDVARRIPGRTGRVAIQAGCSQLANGHAFSTYPWYYVQLLSRCNTTRSPWAAFAHGNVQALCIQISACSASGMSMTGTASAKS